MILMTVLGLFLMFAATGIDVVIRLRLRMAGEKAVFLRGGTLDYGRYLSVRKRFGWSAWPLYAELAMYVVGIVCFVIGMVNTHKLP
jgi:hypothetical protein